MEMQVKLTGLDNLIKDLDKIVNGIDNDIKDVITKGVVDIERTAKIKCPVRFGFLKTSITHKIYLDSKYGWTGRTGTDKEYAPYVEYGYLMTPPRQPDRSDHKRGNTETIPFLQPAYDLHKNRIVDEIKKVTEQRIKSA